MIASIAIAAGCPPALCVPKSSCISCDQAVFVDQTADASLFRTRYWARLTVR
jgi:hypothetical protein